MWAALLGEKHPLSTEAAGLLTQMSYYPNDLALLSWNGALLIEPDGDATATALSLLEFANVQLLLMRYYSSPKPFVNIDPLWARVSSLSPTRII